MGDIGDFERDQKFSSGVAFRGLLDGVHREFRLERVATFAALHPFPAQEPFEIHDELLKFTAAQLRRSAFTRIRNAERRCRNTRRGFEIREKIQWPVPW